MYLVDTSVLTRLRFEGFDRLALEDEAFHIADRTQRRLAKAGLKGRRVPDLIIAAQAELADLTVLHYDADYERIAEVTGQPVRWVVPRGSVD